MNWSFDGPARPDAASVGGATLIRITDGMTSPKTRHLADGSTVYSGAVAAGLIARETGFKAGEHFALVIAAFTLYDVVGHRVYGIFMAASVVSVCYLVVVGAIAALRWRRVA